MRRQPGPPYSSQEEWERYRNEPESRRGNPAPGEQGRPRYMGEDRPQSQYQSERYPGGQEFAGGYSTSGGYAASRQRPYSGHVRYGPEHESGERGYGQQEGFQPRSEEQGRYGREQPGREERGRYGPTEGPWGEEPGPGQYGGAGYEEAWEGRGGYAEEPYEQGGIRRGFGYGEIGHPRHRTGWGDVGRSSVYGQPYGQAPSAYGGAYGGDIARSRRGPKGYVRSDERIREFICERLTEHHALDVSDVSVEVHDGRVTLEGTVPERRMKHAIEDVADDCWGVKEVENRLRVGSRGESGSPQMSGSESLMTGGTPMSGGSSMSAGSPITSPQAGASAGAKGQAGEPARQQGKKEQR